MSESEQIKRRYAERAHRQCDALYDPLVAYNVLVRQEKERAVVRCINRFRLPPVGSKTVLEVGCGGGGNLVELCRLGFSPANLTGVELLEDRARQARTRLPGEVNIITGDATRVTLGPAGFDLVLQSTVFTSILDPDTRRQLAQRMWDWVAPGGGVMWYDFIYDNPKNRDVRGIGVAEIRALFPAGEISFERVTLAPPIGRRVTRLHPWFYHGCNVIPLLRTHVLCWIRKAAPIPGPASPLET